MNSRFLTLIVVVLIGFTNGYSQSNWYSQPSSTSAIHHDLNKLMNPLKILYVAAHPDDENTRLISWLENALYADVAYLSMTKGSGGQNLIGNEIGHDLGLIREQELYAARRTDGGEQYFTTALDFGYSKTHTETFQKWDKQKILSEVVERIRIFQPDIIITRFSPETEGLRRTHGHHTASAILALEAFKAAADPTQFPEQIKAGRNPWKTTAIYWNTSYWSYGGKDKLDSIVTANPQEYLSINVDAFVPDLGLSTSEIAARSRSMHKSQGFGTMARYGENLEYLQLLAGDSRAQDKLTGLTQSMAGKFMLIVKGMNTPNGAISYREALKSYLWNSDERETIKKAWANAIGLRLFASVDHHLLKEGYNTINLKVEHFNSQTLNIATLLNNRNALSPSSKYELAPGILGDYEVGLWLDKDSRLELHVMIDGIQFSIPITYRTSDPVIGEIIQPVKVVQGGQVDLLTPEVLRVNGVSSKVKLAITPVEDVDRIKIIMYDVSGRVLEALSVFTSNEHHKAYNTYTYELDAPEVSSNIHVHFGNKHSALRTRIIKYDHLPWIYSQQTNMVKVHNITATCLAKRIAYVMGAGDLVPEATEALGVQVDLVDPSTIGLKELKTYDAVVFGIRALNVIENIDAYMSKFYDYAAAGGTLVMQYNTAHRLKTKKIGLVENEIILSRGRVTDEEAIVGNSTFHVVMHQPNRITGSDWNHWVQERGLYFPSQWSPDYTAPLSMNDPGEDPLQGSLLIRPIGKGHFVYSGISFFRNLPAGVEGAYKLWANILSL